MVWNVCQSKLALCIMFFHVILHFCTQYTVGLQTASKPFLYVCMYVCMYVCIYVSPLPEATTDIVP